MNNIILILEVDVEKIFTPSKILYVCASPLFSRKTRASSRSRSEAVITFSLSRGAFDVILVLTRYAQME